MKFYKIVNFILSLPKTLYFNFRALKIKQAIKLPIFISYKTRIIEVHKNIISLPDYYKPFMIKIGGGGSPSIPSQKSSVRLQSGKLIFKGGASMSEGIIINVKGNLTIGKGFSSNKNCFLSCTNEVNIGDDVLFGWDCSVFDDNGGHHVLYNGVQKKIGSNDFAINVGNHVWICSYSSILAGASIGEGSILAYKSLLTKKILEHNVLIAGVPAVVKAKSVNWKI